MSPLGMKTSIPGVVLQVMLAFFATIASVAIGCLHIQIRGQGQRAPNCKASREARTEAIDLQIIVSAGYGWDGSEQRLQKSMHLPP
jgi:hypothetical protein